MDYEEQGAPVNETASDQHDDEAQNGSEDEPALTKSEQKFRGQEDASASAAPSLRELQKLAYSPATLHRYKSHPLHHSTRHGTRASELSRKRGVGGSKRNSSRRGGQPDMRLRMSAMLEKIKRDYS